MRPRTPSRRTAMVCLVIFIVGLIGLFIPMGHIAYVGQILKYINHYAVYLLIAGYGLLLTAVYIL